MIVGLRQGDSGLLPVLLGLAALVIYFYIRNSVFLTAGNITNLFIQATIFILLGMAEIWVLLLGEIDLSIGFVAAMGAAVATILVDTHFHWPWFVAFLLVLYRDDGYRVALGSSRGVFDTPFVHRDLGLLPWLAGRVDFSCRQGECGRYRSRARKNPVRPGQCQLHSIVDVDLYCRPRHLWQRVHVAQSSESSLSGLAYRSVYFTVAKVVVMVVAGVILGLVFNTDRFIVRGHSRYAFRNSNRRGDRPRWNVHSD